MNTFSRFTFCLGIITTSIVISACQTTPDTHDSLASKEDVFIQNDTIDNKKAKMREKTLAKVEAIVKNYDGEIVSFASDQQGIIIKNINVCFYKKISQNLKGRIEQELFQATGSNITIIISGKIYPPIGGLNESIFETDPCVYGDVPSS